MDSCRCLRRLELRFHKTYCANCITAQVSQLSVNVPFLHPMAAVAKGFNVLTEINLCDFNMASLVESLCAIPLIDALHLPPTHCRRHYCRCSCKWLLVLNFSNSAVFCGEAHLLMKGEVFVLSEFILSNSNKRPFALRCSCGCCSPFAGALIIRKVSFGKHVRV